MSSIMASQMQVNYLPPILSVQLCKHDSFFWERGFDRFGFEAGLRPYLWSGLPPNCTQGYYIAAGTMEIWDARDQTYVGCMQGKPLPANFLPLPI